MNSAYATEEAAVHDAVNDILRRSYSGTSRITPMSDLDSWEASKVISRYGRDVSPGAKPVTWTPRIGTVPSPGRTGTPGASPNRQTPVPARTGIWLSYAVEPLSLASQMWADQYINQSFSQRRAKSYEELATAVLAVGAAMVARVPPEVKKRTLRAVAGGRRTRIHAFSKA